MRICRFRHQGRVDAGFYEDRAIWPLSVVAEACQTATGEAIALPATRTLLTFLPPAGKGSAAARRLAQWLTTDRDQSALTPLAPEEVELLVPIPQPNKLLLLAGNYAQHIAEGGGVVAERAETFPYVFMKPPTTTLTDPGKPVRIPAISPHCIDWEIELAVIIGRRAKRVTEAEALQYVAGYTIINDISNRKFRPNPDRKQRPRDVFFDWLHGKWHDSFCPCGPCVASPDTIADPQQLDLELRVNGTVRQSASTAQQIFPVAAVIAFISNIVTLEPGDILSTGTPQGVGDATGIYLRPGDQLTASISSIGTLSSPVVAED